MEYSRDHAFMLVRLSANDIKYHHLTGFFGLLTFLCCFSLNQKAHSLIMGFIQWVFKLVWW